MPQPTVPQPADHPPCQGSGGLSPPAAGGIFSFYTKKILPNYPIASSTVSPKASATPWP